VRSEIVAVAIEPDPGLTLDENHTGRVDVDAAVIVVIAGVMDPQRRTRWIGLRLGIGVEPAQRRMQCRQVATPLIGNEAPAIAAESGHVMQPARLRELREERGLSPVDVAAALKVSLASIYNWENGRHEPRVSQLRRLAEFFGVTTDEIVLEEDFIKKAIA